MIRKMRHSDLKQVLEIEDRSFKEPWTLKQYEYEMYDNPYASLWVLENNGTIVGYYDLWIIFENAELANIAVDTVYRNQGYGQQLMDHMQQQAANRGCENISLEVRVSNEAAIRLYEKNDFFTVSLRKDYYKDEDGYRMMKGI